MTEQRWTCYRAAVESKDGLTARVVHVYGMTEDYARKKLIAEYTPSEWIVVNFNFLHYAD